MQMILKNKPELETNFDKWINENYNSIFTYFEKFCFKNYRFLTKESIEDIFNDSIIMIMSSKVYKHEKIQDVNAYFWITLRNETVKYCKSFKKKSKIEVDIYQDNSWDFENSEYRVYMMKNFIEDQSDTFDYKYFNDVGFQLLVLKSKDILDHIEYKTFMNFIYSDMSLKKMSGYIGYHPVTIYKKKATAFDKIKKELNENRIKYLGY